MKIAISLLCLALLIGSSTAIRRPRLIGGVNTNIRNYPYQVSIRLRRQHICGGAILSKNHIITAAHCITADFVPPYNNIEVSTGSSSSVEPGNIFRVLAVTVHPQWAKDIKTSFSHDLAIIKIVGEIAFNENQQKIKLPSNNFVSGSIGVVTGWGRVSSAPSSPISVPLQELSMILLSHADCESKIPIPLFESHLCAFHDEHSGCSYGDSGGPLAVNGELVGVSSWNPSARCVIRVPDVFTNVFNHLVFIEATLNL